jgi:hypothetical protein
VRRNLLTQLINDFDVLLSFETELLELLFRQQLFNVLEETQLLFALHEHVRGEKRSRVRESHPDANSPELLRLLKES